MKKLREVIPELRKWNKAASLHWRIERKRNNPWGKKRYRWPAYSIPVTGLGMIAHGLINKDPSTALTGTAMISSANLFTKKTTKVFDGENGKSVKRDIVADLISPYNRVETLKSAALATFPPTLAHAILEPHIWDIKKIKRNIDAKEGRNDAKL